MNESTLDAKTILDAGAAITGLTTPPNGTPFVVVPEGYAVHDVERLLPSPMRKRGKVTLLDADSYIAYTKEHGSLATCRHYADVDYEASKCTVLGIIA